MLEGGKVAARQTKDLETRGDLLGILSQFKKYDSGVKGVEAALADAEAIRIGLTEGRGDDAPLTKSLLHVAGSLAGDGKRVGSLPELAALIGVTSLSAGAGQADTRSEQLVRGLQGETPEQMAFLKDFAGIEEHDTLEARLDKFVPKLRQMTASGRDPATFLTENKINSEQVRALTEVEPNYELLKKRFASARNGKSGADIMAESAQQAKVDPLQRDRLAKADLAAAELGRGAERQEIQPDITTAKARLIEEQVDTSWSSMLKRAATWAATGFKKEGIDVLAEQRAVNDLKLQLGIADDEGQQFFGGQTPGGVIEGIISGSKSTSGELQEELRLLRRMADAQEKANKMAADANKMAADALKQNKPPAPPAPLALPRGGNAGPWR
jgi:hypothetical protein